MARHGLEARDKLKIEQVFHALTQRGVVGAGRLEERPALFNLAAPARPETRFPRGPASSCVVTG
jgi:hypothetical protein